MQRERVVRSKGYSAGFEARLNVTKESQGGFATPPEFSVAWVIITRKENLTYWNETMKKELPHLRSFCFQREKEEEK